MRPSQSRGQDNNPLCERSHQSQLRSQSCDHCSTRKALTSLTTNQLPSRGSEIQNPARVESIFPELYNTLLHARHTYRDCPDMVRAAMFDVTTALLIRHQLPLGGEDTAQAVREAQKAAQGHRDADHRWALGCAKYVASCAIARKEAHEDDS